MEFIKFKDKQETRAMRFVQDACGDDSRPILSSIRVENGKTVAADGYRLHIAPTPETLKDHVGKQLKPERRIRVTPQPEEFEEVEGTFPDWKAIDDWKEDDDVVVKIALNQNFLADLKDMPSRSDGIVLEIRGPEKPVVITPLDGPEGYRAILMPMRLGK